MRYSPLIAIAPSPPLQSLESSLARRPKGAICLAFLDGVRLSLSAATHAVKETDRGVEREVLRTGVRMVDG